MAAALLSAFSMWGFTVDDALISLRYARHVAGGEGYRFNVGGPVTDGVTPLPWPFLLAPLASADALTALTRARLLGVVCTAASGFVLGHAMARARTPAWANFSALAVFALSVPVGAHAVSGMETALTGLLATLAAVSIERRPTRAAVLAGACAALRPELLPWSLVVAGGATFFDWPRALRVHIARIVLAVLPFACCALVRAAVFGRAAPLAVLAKPSDLAHGATYAVGAAVASLAPILVLSPVALRRAPPAARTVAVAGAAHLVAIALAGGDWMPYARLAAPIVPSLLYAFARTARVAHPLPSALRVVAALGMGVYLLARAAPAGRHVADDRAALVAAARPHLAFATRVAALDVGWPTAATDASLIDLAGLTDPEIAALPGGHTSKRVDAAMLLDRGMDALLLYVDRGLPPGGLGAWPDAVYTRAVEARLAASPLLQSKLSAVAFVPLGARGAGYVVLRRRAADL